VSHARFECYPETPRADEPGQVTPKAWRIRLRGANGEIMFQGSESYPSRSNTRRAIKDIEAVVAEGPDIATVDA